MSPRNFARVFARSAGITPARYVEKLRVEGARRRLEESRPPSTRLPPSAASARGSRCAARSSGPCAWVPPPTAAVSRMKGEPH